MFNKKRLLILLVSVLFIIATIAACKPGMDEEAQEIVDELIKEGPAEMDPTPTPVKVGWRLTDEDFERISKEAWIPVNYKPEDFGVVYAIHGDYDPTTETSMFEFEYRSTLPADELRINFGQPIFQLTPTQNYHSCVWIDEKNSSGDPLETTLTIVEKPDFNTVYIAFMVYGPMLLVPDVFYSIWPKDAPLAESMTSENQVSSWFTYYLESKNMEIGKAWHLQPGGVITSFEWYWDLLKDTPGFDDTPEEPAMEGGLPSPRIGFRYDVFGDGTLFIPGSISAYERAEVITMTFIIDY